MAPSESAPLLPLLLVSIALITGPGRLSAAEAQLEQHDAPQSATTAPTQNTSLQRDIELPLLHPRFTMNWRSYGLGEDADPVAPEHTWASGGKLVVTFPEWRDWLSASAAVYGSFPIGDAGAPNHTRVVAPDGGHLLVGGETYLDARQGSFDLRLFRQLLDAPYLNDFDNRMIPNVFEAATLLYHTESVYAGFGYVSRIKMRDSDEYVSMAEAAGARGSDSGVVAGGMRWQRSKRLTVHAFMLRNTDVFSTAYVAADFDKQLTTETDVRLSAQLTSQRSVGDALLGDFDANTVGLKAALGYRGAVFTLAATITGDGADIRSPFGQRPAYLSMMLFNFDRAAEDGRLVGVSYRLEAVGLPSWSLVANHGEGKGARDRVTHRGLGDRRETDVTLDYRPSSGVREGLWLRLRYADASDGDLDLSQWRVTLNYEIKTSR